MNQYQLKEMFHIWIQGRDYDERNWIDFVEHVSKTLGYRQDIIMKELQKATWFNWTREE